MIFVLAILLLVFLVSISFFVFHQKTSALLSDMSIQNISEVQDLYARTLQAKFADQLNMLEAQSRYFDDVDLGDDDALRRTISSTRGIGEFKKIAVASREGVCTNYTGQTLSNIYNKAYFFDTVKTGLPQISNRIEVDENIEPILTLTYPIKRGGSVEAVIIGTLSYSVLKNLFTVPIFSGKSYMYIIAVDGNIILCNRELQRNLYNVNFYDYLRNNSASDNDTPVINKMKSDVVKNDAGFMLFHGKDARKIFSYAPLGINNWYIVSAVPYSYILQQQGEINVLVYLFIGVMAFIIFMFIFVFYVLFRMTSSIEKDNERLTIANNQAQSLIFEFDLQRQMVDFSGDTQFILGTDKKNFAADFIRAEYYKRIHADDVSVTEHLHETLQSLNADFSAEFRYKCFSNEYIWLRMTGSLISKGDGKGQKFIGSINNVNAQVLHEQELKSIAEMDKLTGLLNKSAMEQNARKCLAADSCGQKCALFIIDLDNFKKVNDTLGHMVGDMAIVDAAKKLSLIFSEKDFISRFGGDEFCILLRMSRNLDDETVSRIIQEKAQNLCTFLREDYFDDKTIIEVSASVGIALYPEGGEDYGELFKHADEALYQVKKGGKNGYRIFERGDEKAEDVFRPEPE